MKAVSWLINVSLSLSQAPAWHRAGWGSCAYWRRKGPSWPPLSYCCITWHWGGFLKTDRPLVRDDTGEWGSPPPLVPSVSCLPFVISAIQQPGNVTGKGMGAGEEDPRTPQGLNSVSSCWALAALGITLGMLKGIRQGLPSFICGFETGNVSETTWYL